MASDHLMTAWTLIFGMLVAKGFTQSQTPVDRTAIEGDHVELRCDTAYDRTKDFYWSERVLSIILYRAAGADVNNVTIPISRYRGRVSLVGLDSSNLKIKNVTKADEGSYNCQQVGAVQQGTLQRLQVFAAVPPDPAAPTITGYSGGFLTPGSNVTLTCVSTGARPPANLTWWTGNTQLKARNSSTPDSTWQGDTTSEVTIADLKLSDNGRVYQCRASHRALAQVETSQVTVSVAYPSRGLSGWKIAVIVLGVFVAIGVIIGIVATAILCKKYNCPQERRSGGDSTEMRERRTGGATSSDQHDGSHVRMPPESEALLPTSSPPEAQFTVTGNAEIRSNGDANSTERDNMGRERERRSGGDSTEMGNMGRGGATSSDQQDGSLHPAAQSHEESDNLLQPANPAEVQPTVTDQGGASGDTVPQGNTRDDAPLPAPVEDTGEQGTRSQSGGNIWHDVFNIVERNLPAQNWHVLARAWELTREEIANIERDPHYELKDKLRQVLLWWRRRNTSPETLADALRNCGFAEVAELVKKRCQTYYRD